ncbi:DUF4097 family beta strand repeat-containing protein [Streptomyces pristinaespiralis]|uniref:DUF4097 family beta strand repeat-containing protein n=1 Tax=Streptomyces pristinaespiralis TaxID=38300 RepID=UPI003401E269
MTSGLRRHHRRAVRGGVAACGVVLLAVGLSGCGSADASEAPVEKKSFPLSAKTLTIASDNTDIELVPADVDEVEVTRQVDGWVFLGSGPDASWKMADGTLTLKVKCDAIASDCVARHTVKVPRGTSVTVDDDNGSVTASGFDTALKLRSDNGSVKVTDSSGALELDSENGSVVAEGVTGKNVVATSDNGSVRLELAAVPDRVETHSDNGRVEITLPGAGAPYAVDAKSDNGDVDVAVPTDDNSARVVKARSDNGEVVVRSAN